MKLHEKKVSELVNACLPCEGHGLETVKESLEQDCEKYDAYSDPAIEYSVLKQWAIAKIKNCHNRVVETVIIVDDDGTVKTKQVYCGDYKYTICDTCLFLREHFEISEDDINAKDTA